MHISNEGWVDLVQMHGYNNIPFSLLLSSENGSKPSI